VLAAIVLAALFLNSSQLTRSLLEQRDVEATVRDWIDDDSGHQVVTTVIDGDAVSIVVIGPSEGLGETQELANQLSDNLGRPVEVNIRLVVEERLTATSDT
jgi:hypothetical protein